MKRDTIKLFCCLVLACGFVVSANWLFGLSNSPQEIRGSSTHLVKIGEVADEWKDLDIGDYYYDSDTFKVYSVKTYNGGDLNIRELSTSSFSSYTYDIESKSFKGVK